MAIDLNADLGEGFGIWQLGNDAGLLDVVTSANVACGFHAGDPVTMRHVCERAVARGVAIGAQVAYRDLVGFGRRRMDVPPHELAADVLYQIGALDAFARAAGDRVRYVKPHGALYHAAADDAEVAAAITEAIADYNPTLALVGMPDTESSRAAKLYGIRYVSEAFADRAYLSNGRLVPRRHAGAVIEDQQEVVKRTLQIVTEGTVETADHQVIEIEAETLCLHGDTAGADHLARAVRDHLISQGIAVQPFVS